MGSEQDVESSGRPTVIPRVFVDDPAGLVDFVRDVLGGEGEFVPGRPTEIRIGSAVLMISGTAERLAATAFLYVYVPDVDAAHEQAVGRGATSLEEPIDQAYGDRRAMVRDPWGITWQFATPRG